MFSRISVALKKSNAVTLEELIKVIQQSFTPTPVVIKMENIYDVKSWQRPYVSTFKYHSHPHAFRFKLNNQGEVEMTYRNLANTKRKEWLPKEGPFIVMRQLPPGKPSVLKPDLKKCPSVDTIKGATEKLKVRMSVVEWEWWQQMAKEEEEKVKQWSTLTAEEYQEAGQSFDLFEMRYQEPDRDVEEIKDEEYEKREKELERLIEKKNNHLQVCYILQILVFQISGFPLTSLQLNQWYFYKMLP